MKDGTVLYGSHFININFMKKYILFLLIFSVSTAAAQTPDSCEQIRLRWADHSVNVNEMVQAQYRTRYFPEAKPQPKINLWANSQPFKIGTYRITNTKLAGWAVLSFAGAIDGIVEGYEFDGRTSFERKYGVNPNGYFGSRSWEKAHTKETLYAKYFGAWDFYHNADDVRKIGYISGGVMIGIGGLVNTKWWHYAVDVAASFAVSGVAKSAGMFWIRN